MKPLNTQERNSAFWSFALFFALTVGLITLAVYFTFIIPQKNYTELKNKVKDYTAFKAKQNLILAQIDTINKDLQQYNTPGANQSYLQNDISNKNIAFGKAIGEENETNKIYHKIKENYNNMLIVKSKLNDAKIQLSQANNELNNCEQDNRKVEKELKDLQEKKK